MVKYRHSLWPEQLRRRVGKPVWVSKIGSHFWPDITCGEFRMVSQCLRLPNGEAVCFEDGTRLLLKELGTKFVCFDFQPAENEKPACHADSLVALREEFSMCLAFNN